MSEPAHPSPGQPESPEQPRPARAPEPVPSVTMEDSSSQALTEALHSSFRIIKLIMLLLVFLFFCSGVFVVQPNEVAVLLRFGKPVGIGAERLLKPGWHWAFPYPIDEVVSIPVGQSQTVTSSSGWHATNPEIEAGREQVPAYGSLRPEADGYTLSGDGNIIHVRATIKYRVADPIRYKLDFANPPEILTNIINEAIFYASARFNADEALYKNKIGFREAVLARVREKLDTLNLGITLEPSDVEVKAPADVRVAFERVTTAENERGTEISKALSYSDELTRTALGQADALINSGLVSSNSLVSQVSADALAFTAQLPSYLADAQLFKQRLLASAMERILTNANVKFTLPEQFDELRLQLSREPEKVEAKEQR